MMLLQISILVNEIKWCKWSHCFSKPPFFRIRNNAVESDEKSDSGRGRQYWRKKRDLVRKSRLSSICHRVCRRPRQRLALSVPLLQKRRRWVINNWYYSLCSNFLVNLENRTWLANVLDKNLSISIPTIQNHSEICILYNKIQSESIKSKFLILLNPYNNAKFNSNPFNLF